MSDEKYPSVLNGVFWGKKKEIQISFSKINLSPRNTHREMMMMTIKKASKNEFASSYLGGDECGEVSSGKQLVFVHAFDDVERCGDFRPLAGHGAVVEASQAVDFQSVQGFLEER